MAFMAKKIEKPRTSYFKDEELDLMKNKFLDFPELASYSIKLFQRSWWKAFLAPILWSLICIIGFIVVSAIGGFVFGLIITLVTLSKQTALIGIAWLFVFGVILAWVLGYIYLIFQIYMRSLVLLGDSGATFWKPNTKIWSVFSRILGLGFILAPISLLISTITLTVLSTSGTENIMYTVINSSAVSVLSIWISGFLFPFSALVLFKGFNVKQALLAGWQMNKTKMSDLVYRNFFIALVIALPLILQSYISYNFVINKASDPKLLAQLLASYIVLLIVGTVSGTILKYLCFTSYTNIYLLNQTKEAREFELSEDQNSKLDNIVILAIVLAVVMVVVYFWAYFGYASKITPSIPTQQSSDFIFMESK